MKRSFSVLAAILVAVVLIAVVGCNTPGGTATPPATATPQPTPTATVCPNFEGAKISCEALIRGQGMLECWVDLEVNPRIQHLINLPAEPIWDILDEGDRENLEVTLDECGRPTQVDRIYVDAVVKEWPGP